MIEDVMVKTHLIVTGIHEEYTIKWQGRIIDTDPLLVNGKPIFIIIGSQNRLELNTIDMKYIEESAKKLTKPTGRASVTTDNAAIYIKEKSGAETRIGIVTHKHIKDYVPMYDKIGYM